MPAEIVSVLAGDVGKITIERAASLLREGKLVAFPTETVYGLGVNLLNEEAVEKVFQVKQRSREKPLPVMVSDTVQLKNHVSVLSDEVTRIIRFFLPGPLTVLLIADSGPCKGKKIAIRMPDNWIARELLDKARVPVGATSANVSGRPSPLSAEDVFNNLGNLVAIILDGGPVLLAEDSTIVDCTGSEPFVIRKGPVSEKEILDVFYDKNKE